MPFRPASAPAGPRRALTRSADLTTTGVELQKTLAQSLAETTGRPPFLAGSFNICQLPKDPLPDDSEDEEPQAEDETKKLTLSPKAVKQLASTAPGAAFLTTEADPDGKWWHVPDGRIEDLVESIREASSVLDDCVDSNAKLLHCCACPSSTCRAMTNAGKPVNGFMDMTIASRSPVHLASHLRDTAAGHCNPDAFATSSTLRRDIQLKDAVAKGMTWPLENRQQFNNWATPKLPVTDAHLLLNATKPAPKNKISGSGQRARKKPMQKASSHSSLSKSSPQPTGSANSEDRHLIQVDLTFKENSDRISVLIHQDSRIGPDAGIEHDKMTLKGMVSKLTGIASGDQRLLCRGHDVSEDQMTIRKNGISHGSTITVYNKQDMKCKEVVLACTKKRLDIERKNLRRDAWRQSAQKQARQSDGSLSVQPKWGWSVPTDNTKLGIGYNGLGKNSSFKFENTAIWHDPHNIDVRLTDIRSHQAYIQAVTYVSPGISPHCQ